MTVAQQVSGLSQSLFEANMQARQMSDLNRRLCDILAAFCPDVFYLYCKCPSKVHDCAKMLLASMLPVADGTKDRNVEWLKRMNDDEVSRKVKDIGDLGKITAMIDDGFSKSEILAKAKISKERYNKLLKL